MLSLMRKLMNGEFTAAHQGQHFVLKNFTVIDGALDRF